MLNIDVLKEKSRVATVFIYLSLVATQMLSTVLHITVAGVQLLNKF